MVFRRIYGEEIELVSAEAIEDEFKKELAAVKRRASGYRGMAAEYKVRYRLLAASLADASLSDLVTGQTPPDLTLDSFASIGKARFHLDQERSVEIDLHAVSDGDDGTDLMVEVKDWEREPSVDAVRRFVEVKEALAGRLARRTEFLFYSESGLSEKSAAMLAAAGIWVLDPEKLARYETPPGLWERSDLSL